MITAVIVELVAGHPRLPRFHYTTFQSEFQMNHTGEISSEEGVLTAMRVTGVKTPPGFVGNVRCGCVTMEICTHEDCFGYFILGLSNKLLLG